MLRWKIQKLKVKFKFLKNILTNVLFVFSVKEAYFLELLFNCKMYLILDSIPGNTTQEKEIEEFKMKEETLPGSTEEDTMYSLCTGREHEDEK